MAEGEVRRMAFETARLRLARVRRSATSARESGYKLIATIMADALAIERVGIWMMDANDERLVCQLCYQRSGRHFESGEVLAARDFPRYLATLRECRALVADDARHHPMTAELTEKYLAPHGIYSMLDAPIIREGRVVGVVCHESVGVVRRWSQQEIDFVGSAADIVALVLEQADRVELESALKLSLEQRLESEKLEAVGRLARSIAHDLNNLLTVVVGIAETARGSNCSTCHLSADTLAGTAAFGQRLVGQLVDLGSRQLGAATPVDVSAVVRSTLPTLRAVVGESATFVADLDATSARVCITHAELEQILLNLVLNAREALVRPGHIHVVLRDPLPDDELPPNRVVLEVSDDGIGMDEHTRAHLFEPYFSTKPSGTGLGLAIVYGIVKRAGGAIEVASTNAGSTFRVVFPTVVS